MPGRGRRPATSLTGEQIYAGERERAGDVTDRRRTTLHGEKSDLHGQRDFRERERGFREREMSSWEI
jgi:hypothetical protein